MIGMSVVDTTDTAFSFTDLATITKYDTIISTAITQSERHMKLDSPLTSTFFFLLSSHCVIARYEVGIFPYEHSQYKQNSCYYQHWCLHLYDTF